MSLDIWDMHLRSAKKWCIRLAPDRPSYTVTTLPDDFVHYRQHRILTAREWARLQSFDDTFIFLGPRATGGGGRGNKKRNVELPQYTQIGNAVPPLLARGIGNVILSALDTTMGTTRKPSHTHDLFSKVYREFENDPAPERRQLAGELSRTRACFDIFQGGDPEASLGDFIGRYNWLGTSETKVLYGINQNLARNLVGSMFQDYLLNLCIKICRPFPNLDTFTESRISFGRYPLWQAGTVTWASPSEYSDIAIVYLMENEEIVPGADAWPKPPRIRVDPGQKIIPLVTINSKIRVSQSEFFDWHGREQLMTKGNPHCFSIQVVLRKEMDMSIVEATQAAGKFFLLGGGGERNVAARPGELERLVAAISGHLQAHTLP